MGLLSPLVALAAHFASLPLVAGRIAIVASAGVAVGQADLRYAERDADRTAAVLRELGGFERVYQLREPRPPAVREALDAVERAAERDPELEVVFYYSGHADDQGLLLGTERFAFSELRARLEQSRARLRVALLDACFSGSIVRPKGGQPAPGFAVEAAELPQARGAAIISAGTASELAQESAEIEGSFFTHHVLSALRGAGDRDGDGAVTLAEAYQYAYGHTLAATLPSRWGAQHPSYEYRLSGTGDLVMTRVGGNRRALTFPAGRNRTYLVSSVAGEVMAEIAARPEGRVRLVLPPGRYRVVAREDERTSRADVTLTAGAPGDVALDGAAFHEVAGGELAFAKGATAGPRHELAVDVGLGGLGPGTLNGTPELGGGYLFRAGAFSVGAHVGRAATEGSVERLPYTLQRWTATALFLRRTPVAFSELHWGLALGGAWIREKFGTDPTQPTRLGGGPTGAVVLGLDLPLARWLALRLWWSAGGGLLRVNGAVQIEPELRASLGVVFRR